MIAEILLSHHRLNEIDSDRLLGIMLHPETLTLDHLAELESLKASYLI